MNLTLKQRLSATPNAKIYAVIIVAILNWYFFIGLCIGHIPITYMVWLLFFNVVSFTFIVIWTAFFKKVIYAKITAVCILISTIIFTGYYVKINL